MTFKPSRKCLPVVVLVISLLTPSAASAGPRDWDEWVGWVRGFIVSIWADEGLSICPMGGNRTGSEPVMPAVPTPEQMPSSFTGDPASTVGPRSGR